MVTIILHAPWWPASFNGWAFLVWVLISFYHLATIARDRWRDSEAERKRETAREIYERVSKHYNTQLMRERMEKVNAALPTAAELSYTLAALARATMSDPARNFECVVDPKTGKRIARELPSYTADGRPVPSFTLQDFMQLKPAPLPPPPLGHTGERPLDDDRTRRGFATESDLSALPTATELTSATEGGETTTFMAPLRVSDPTDVNAREQGGPTHREYLATLAAAKAAHDAALRRAPHIWRCDVCGYTETLTNDEVALREDGLGDLWKSHWPAKAEGAAADVLCSGRVIRIGRVGEWTTL